MDIKITMDAEGSLRALIRHEEALRDLAPVLAALAGEIDDRVQNAFENKADPTNLAAWPELTAATQKDRARKGFNATDILQRTRILRQGVVTEPDQSGVTVSAGSVEYAMIHQKGGSKIPQRRFAGASPDDVELFHDMLSKHVLGLS